MKNIRTYLDEDQASALLLGTWGRWGVRDRQMLVFLLNTGLKIREFVELNVEDVFTGTRVRKTLTVRKSEKHAAQGRSAIGARVHRSSGWETRLHGCPSQFRTTGSGSGHCCQGNCAGRGLAETRCARKPVVRNWEGQP